MITGQTWLFGGSVALTVWVLAEMWATCDRWVRWALGWSVVGLSVVALLAHGIANSFTGEGINEATWYHVREGLQGVQAAQMAPFVALVGVVGVAVGLLALLSARRCAHLKTQGRPPRPRLRRWMGVFLLGMVLPLNPAVVQVGQAAWFQLFRADHQAAMRSAIRVPVWSPPPRPRSLVYLYAESLERTFLDGARFPGLAPRLTALEAEGLSIRGMAQAPFTGWTIAGLEASQCGMPLVGNGTTPCLGDALAAAGHDRVFLGGADAEFAGKGEFLNQHGFSEVLDRDDLVARLPQPVVLSDWGVTDVDLFAAARTEFDRLAAAPRPFALVLLTLGTHPPGGHADAQCRRLGPYGDGSNPMLNAIRCSDVQITDFVAHVQSSGRTDVVVVVASDHLQMNSSALPLLQAPGVVRENLWFAVGSGIEKRVIRRASTPFDIAPTVLGLLGWSVPEMGWGRDLRGTRPTLMEQWGERQVFLGIKSLYTLDRSGYWRMEDGAMDEATPIAPAQGVNLP